MKKGFQKSVVQSILKALSFTEKDLAEDYRQSISKSSRNGLSQAVWAKRSDILDDEFENCSDIEVLHVPRTKIWQIDPVFDQANGVLYLLFSTNTLYAVKKRFQIHGKYTHYSVSLLLLNAGKEALDGEQLTLFSMSDEDTEKMTSRRKADILKIVGERGEKIKDVIVVHSSYLNGEAISAEVAVFNDNFELCEATDVSNMLESGYDISSEENTVVTHKTPSTPDGTSNIKRIVRLKNNENQQNKN